MTRAFIIGTGPHVQRVFWCFFLGTCSPISNCILPTLKVELKHFEFFLDYQRVLCLRFLHLIIIYFLSIVYLFKTFKFMSLCSLASEYFFGRGSVFIFVFLEPGTDPVNIKCLLHE